MVNETVNEPRDDVVSIAARCNGSSAFNEGRSMLTWVDYDIEYVAEVLRFADAIAVPSMTPRSILISKAEESNCSSNELRANAVAKFEVDHAQHM